MEKLYSIKEVGRLLGLARSSLYRLRKEDPSFPRPLQLSVKRIGWIREELQVWIESRPRVGGTNDE